MTTWDLSLIGIGETVTGADGNSRVHLVCCIPNRRDISVSEALRLDSPISDKNRGDSAKMKVRESSVPYNKSIWSDDERNA